MATSSKLSAEQRIERAHVQLMRDPNFAYMSGILMLGTTTVMEDAEMAPIMPPGYPPTAGTDGKNTIFSRGFVGTMSDEELKFVILHEAKHKMYRHLSIWRHLYDIDPSLANQANDHVINLQLLEKPGIKMPAVCQGCADPKYKGMDSGQVFRLLQTEQKKGGKGQFDVHEWGKANGLNEAQQKELERQIDQAIRQGAILAGKMGAGLDREIQELMKPKADWKQLLRDFIMSVCKAKDESTWARPNRRFISQGVYLPSLQGKTIGPLVVGIDTSGSIGGDILAQFFSELVSICELVSPERVYLYYWDTSAYGPEVYEQGEYENMVSSTKPKGGGGTDPACIPNRIRKDKIKCEAVIMFTDGYVGSWGDWSGINAPVLWAILENEAAVPDHGKAVYL